MSTPFIFFGFSHVREFEREPGLSVLRALGHESRERLQRLHHVIHAVQNSGNVLEGPQASTADHGDGGEVAMLVVLPAGRDRCDGRMRHL